jgi:hypothetical protein
MRLTVNVSGSVVVIDANPGKQLWNAMNQAWGAAGLIGEAWENWGMRDSTGKLLDRKALVKDFEFGPDTIIFLSRKPGIAA